MQTKRMSDYVEPKLRERLLKKFNRHIVKKVDDYLFTKQTVSVDTIQYMHLRNLYICDSQINHAAMKRHIASCIDINFRRDFMRINMHLRSLNIAKAQTRYVNSYHIRDTRILIMQINSILDQSGSHLRLSPGDFYITQSEPAIITYLDTLGLRWVWKAIRRRHILMGPLRTRFAHGILFLPK